MWWWRPRTLDPSGRFCSNPAGRCATQCGAGTVVVHSRQERRSRCTACGKTFAAPAGTPFYRRRSAPERGVWVIGLLAHGCPLQAIVAVFGLDERTVAARARTAGRHARAVHREPRAPGAVARCHVQADERWVKRRGRVVWVATAIEAPTRRWLGAAVARPRDAPLIARPAAQVVACAASGASLLCVDGFHADAGVFRAARRTPRRTGRRGRPRPVLPDGLQLAQGVKRRTGRIVRALERRVVRGTAAAITGVLLATRSGRRIHTADVARFNATLRSRLAPLGRRNRRLLATDADPSGSVYLAGVAYNLGRFHAALAHRGPDAAAWTARTPAMAAGLAAHRWTVAELLHHRPRAVPEPVPHRPPKPRTVDRWAKRAALREAA